MTNATPPPYELILKLCAQAGMEPWYPGEFAASMGIEKRKLEGPLDDLRLAGLIEKTDWQPGTDQGYRLTRDGAAVVNSPQGLRRIRDGSLPRFAKSSPESNDEFENGPRPVPGNSVASSLVNSSRPIMTYLILATNVGLFLLAMYLALRGKQGGMKGFLLMGDDEARHRTGGLHADDLLRGQWWRLFTTVFVHRDIFHLLINMSTFMSVAPRAEQIWGRCRYLAIFLLAGFGSVCITLWNNPTDSRLGGVAGAMCGLMLGTAAWYVLNRAQLPREVARGGTRQLILAFVWWMVWMGLFGWFGNVKFWWVGYVSGAVIGLLVAVLLNIQRYWNNPVRWTFLVLIPIIPIACIGLVLHSKDQDPRWRQVKQQAKERQDDEELDLFNNDLAPEIQKCRDSVDEQWDAIEGLLLIDAPKRDEAKLARTRVRLGDLREQVNKTEAAIDRAGPLKFGRVVDALKAARNFMAEEKKLIEMTEQALDAGKNWTDDDNKKLKQQLQEVQRAIRIYKKKLV